MNITLQPDDRNDREFFLLSLKGAQRIVADLVTFCGEPNQIDFEQLGQLLHLLTDLQDAAHPD